jgi:beta-barrel assembly-enhancing protease
MVNLKWKIATGKMKIQKLILISLLFCTCFIIGCASNPITGQEEMMFDRDYRSDIKMGKEIAPEVEKELKGKIKDQQIQDYINNVGHKLTKISHNPEFDFNFVAVNDKSVNALSLPGGRIFITKGLLEKLDNESQLAGILGHEIIHVVARDAENMMSKEVGLGALFVVAASQARTVGEVAAADVAHTLVIMSYSRDDEKTADLGGLDYIIRAGYDPNGIIETMQILQKEDSSGHSDYFSTHPSPENRIDYIKARIQTLYAEIPADAKIGRDEYHQFVLDRLKKLPVEGDLYLPPLLPEPNSEPNKI